MSKATIKRKNNKNKKKKTRRRVKLVLSPSSTNYSISGQPVAAGGFGCVFKPPLYCVKYPLLEKYNKTFVSKMMLDKYAKEEMDVIKEFRPHIKKIANYNEYFIIDDIYSCQPKQLRKSSLKNFDKICTSFNSYTKKTVNKNIDDFELVNSPDGGVDLEKFWMSLFTTKKDVSLLFAVTNICMINLLNKGIQEMNKNNIYHLDLKSSNILHSTKNNKLDSIEGVKVRIIDWGLAVYKPSKRSFPNKLLTRPFQFNMPFSTILLHKDVDTIIHEIVKIYNENNKVKIKNLNKTSICQFIANEIYEYSLYRLGKGHIEYIKETIKLFYNNLYGSNGNKINKSKEKNENMEKNIIISYLAVILETYTNDNYDFDWKSYINEIYLKNVDIWGFLMSYVDLTTKT
ncbi:MAG: hypothetical protein ACW98D_20405, partial [Promethearchaeota archaeon]